MITNLTRRLRKDPNGSGYSDITIKSSSGSLHPAHLVILHTVTPFFTNALSRSSNFAESISRIVELPEYSLQCVDAFLDLCYTGRYEAQSKPELDVEVFKLADYLLAEDVEGVITDSFKLNLEKMVDCSTGDHDEIWKVTLPVIVHEVCSGNWTPLRQTVLDVLLKAIVDGVHSWDIVKDVLDLDEDLLSDATARYHKAAQAAFKKSNIPAGVNFHQQPVSGHFSIQCPGCKKEYLWHETYIAISALTCDVKGCELLFSVKGF